METPNQGFSTSPTPGSLPSSTPPPDPTPPINSGPVTQVATRSFPYLLAGGLVVLMLVGVGTWLFLRQNSSDTSKVIATDNNAQNGSPSGNSGNFEDQSSSGSCEQYLNREFNTRDFPTPANVPSSFVTHGIFKPTTSLSSLTQDNFLISPSLKVASKLYPETPLSKSEVYLLCASASKESIINYYKNYFKSWSYSNYLDTNPNDGFEYFIASRTVSGKSVTIYLGIHTGPSPFDAPGIAATMSITVQ